MGKQTPWTRKPPSESDEDGDQRPNPGPKGHSSVAAGHVKIRSYMTQRGRPAANITIPIEIMEKFGWMPGMYLSYYPTTGRELVLVSQDQAMVHLSPDYDLSLTPKGQPLPGPRPGSIAEREVQVTEHYEGLMADMQRRRMGLADADAGPAPDGLAAIDAMIEALGPPPTGSADPEAGPRPHAAGATPRPRSRRKSR